MTVKRMTAFWMCFVMVLAAFPLAVSAATPTVYDLASFEATDWAANPTVMHVENNAAGNLLFYNTNGQWPDAGYIAQEPVYVTVADTELVYDITTEEGVDTSVLLFFDGTTFADPVAGKNMAINEYLGGFCNCVGDLLGGQTVKGSIKLSDLPIPSGVIDEKGNVLISGVKVFAAGAAYQRVIIRDLAVSTTGDAGEPPVKDDQSGGNTANAAVHVNGTSTWSMLPESVSEYYRVYAGGGGVSISQKGDTHVFSSTAGWPSAYTTTENNAEMWAVDFSDDDVYLNWDFEVKSGAAKVVVYLCGQNPADLAAVGNFITLNGIINPDWYDPSTGDTIPDLGVGVYKGSLQLSKLYKDVDLATDPHVNPFLFIDNGEGEFCETNFSGFKVFAVGGEVVLSELSLGKKTETAKPVEPIVYPDVKSGEWYYDAVGYVSEKGYMSGYKSGNFGPVNNLQRQDFVVTLARIAGADLTAYAGQTGGLSDVKPNAYYASAVAWAVDYGIVTGYKSGAFGVGDTISREQVCTILHRYVVGVPSVSDVEGTLSAFPDNKKISPFAKDAMAWAVANGVISGLKSGNISPLTGASRAQIATIIMRMDQSGLL